MLCVFGLNWTVGRFLGISRLMDLFEFVSACRFLVLCLMVFSYARAYALVCGLRALLLLPPVF